MEDFPQQAGSLEGIWVQVLKLAASLFFINALVVLLVEGDWMQIVALLIANALATVFFFRQFHMVTPHDLQLYFSNKVGSVLERLLVSGVSI
jgi:hypothetical protein